MGQRSILKPEFQKRRRAELNRPVFEWGGVFEKWARGFVKRNFWRVSALFLSEEDALQECAIVFVRCRNKYAGKLDEPKHMMALYQMALTRAWHTFATKDPHFRWAENSSALPPSMAHNDGPLAVLLSQCDAELKTLMRAISNAPSEFLSLVFENDDQDTGRITRKAALVLGVKYNGRDLVGELRDLLSA